MVNNYPAKLSGISPDTQPIRPYAKLAKIREYSTRLSRIIVLLFNNLSMKLCLYSALQDFRQILATYIYRRISVMYR